tara:strand:+ start:235 stop:414 length:180 start_codon:yes stop_codon:yes gene_type:complete
MKITTNQWDETVVKVNIDELDNDQIAMVTGICREALDSLNINSYFDIELSIILVNKERT